MWQVCIFIFTLSHGQAPVERGFNVNKDTEVENLEEDSLVAPRLVYDTIVSRDDIDIVNREIPSDLSLSCQLAHKKYEEYHKSKKKVAHKSLMGEKRKLLQDEYAEVKRKKTEEEDIVANLESNVNKYITLAAAEEDHVKMKHCWYNEPQTTRHPDGKG